MIFTVLLCSSLISAVHASNHLTLGPEEIVGFTTVDGSFILGFMMQQFFTGVGY